MKSLSEKMIDEANQRPGVSRFPDVSQPIRRLTHIRGYDTPIGFVSEVECERAGVFPGDPDWATRILAARSAPVGATRE